MYNDFMQYMLPTVATVLGAVLTALAGYIITYINKKNKALQSGVESATAKKYMDMVTKTISDCVLSVNQTYVENLKKQNAFTKEAQEEAFKMAYKNVTEILSTDAYEYIEQAFGDVEKYLTTKIEAEVNNAK